MKTTIKIRAITWKSHLPALVRAAGTLAWADFQGWSGKEIEKRPELMETIKTELAGADILFFYRSTEPIWDEIDQFLKGLGEAAPPLVCLSHDPALWALSTVRPPIIARAYQYMIQGDEANMAGLLAWLGREIGGLAIDCQEPLELPWEGLYHPRAEQGHFESISAYLDWYRPDPAKARVGILLGRHAWAGGATAVEDRLIAELEGQGLAVIPVFSYSMQDKETGARGSYAAVRDYFVDQAGATGRIKALVKTNPFFLSGGRTGSVSETGTAAAGVELLKELDIPVFSPVISYQKTAAEWEADPQGISEVGWAVAMPEFEGVIEPLIIGAGQREGTDSPEERAPIAERCHRLARRVKKWLELGEKPRAKRKIAFILHNNPCRSVEASVGVGAHLDTLESVARILNFLKGKGYGVEAPADGRELIDTIMARKAISEFRWTTVEEIVAKGGALARVSLTEYQKWWQTFPEAVRERISAAWGEPPGREKDGVPAAMVHEGKILITGVAYGKAVVCVQPKRGCAGPRCDGRVCKILHDPDIPPPHQYLATYRWLEEYKADVIVHVGTHGNLEFLPGKGVGLSESCLPDLAIHELPHLYIYNSDNPPEGTIAKRRSCATLVDHMQTVMTQSGLYDELEELGRFLGEYEQAKISDPGRAHALEHLIMELIDKTNLDQEIRLGPEADFSELSRAAHEALSRIRNTQIQDGMHIFGKLPKEKERASFIAAVLRHDPDWENSPRKIICRAMGLELKNLLADQGGVDARLGRSHGELLEEIEGLAVELICEALEHGGLNVARFAGLLGPRLITPPAPRQLEELAARIFDLNERIEASREIEALEHGFDAGYIPAGPSGLITRGRDDILPTGRNFYSLDPQRVPTKAAWRIGQKLAEAVIAKHQKEEGRYPENMAIYWMCTDIMWTDGEAMAQIMALLGVRPQWRSGRVNGFEIIPLSELCRPRIDVTIRLSGITRDNFPDRVDLLDTAIQAVAALDEPEEMNFVRRHSLERLAQEGKGQGEKQWRQATFRIFSSRPGTYQPGVNLAIYASAWKDEKDLAEIFVHWNGFAYGKDVFGQEAHTELGQALSTVDLTYNKVVSDEYDLFGCCCYFGSHGGLSAAASHLSGHKVKNYYGDTREPEHVEVRDLADEIRRVVRTKLLNPKWIQGMKRHGYKGAGDISGRVGRVYGWEATTNEVDDWIFDDIARTFVMDEENRAFFEEHNPHALEEIGRRLLEAEGRGLWQADPEVLRELKSHYLEIEGWIEEGMGDTSGDFQGGSVDIITTEEVAGWQEKVQGVRETLARVKKAITN